MSQPPTREPAVRRRVGSRASGPLLTHFAFAAIRAYGNFRVRVTDSCQQQLWAYKGPTLVETALSTAELSSHITGPNVTGL